MFKGKTLVSVISAAAIVALVVATPANAWHPKGEIVKKVQNQTTGSALSDANTEKDAVEAKPGDVLRYVIEISNTAEAAGQAHNDMVKTVMTDTLPAGVELSSDVSKREITENIGRVVPKQKVTKEYLVKVTADKDGQVINNKACFTGDTEVNDNPQKGCDNAIVKVKVPVTPPKEEEKPKEEPKKEEPKSEAPAELPSTGPAAAITGLVGLSSVGYAAHNYLRSRRNLRP